MSLALSPNSAVRTFSVGTAAAVRRSTLSFLGTLGLAGVLALPLSLPLGGCSKGGADTGPGCRKLSDPEPGMGSSAQLPTRLYAELKSPLGTVRGIDLDGSGGEYAGDLVLGKCDEQGPYTVERVVLVDASKRPVAIATRRGSIYEVRYNSGQLTSVSGATFANYATEYRTAATSGAVTVQLLAPQPLMVKQAESVSVSINLMSTDECGLKSSTWWLANWSTGAKLSGDQVLSGASGMVSLRVPATITDNVYVEGSIVLKNGKTLLVRRRLAADTNYTIIDEKAGTSVPTAVAINQIMVTQNPDADRVAPQAVSFDADPPKVERCEKVRLSLTLSDDRALPPSQTVKIWLGTNDSAKLFSATLMGGNTKIGGEVQLPQDAPHGVWYAYPEKVMDAVGNEAVGSFSAGKFTLNGAGVTPMPVMAATFIIPAPPNVPVTDMGASVDMAVPTPPPDMAMGMPATLAEVGFSPTVIMRDGEPSTLRVRWVDNAGILK
jgi:hypothetical protein